MTKNQESPVDIQQQALAFRAQFRTVLIATSDAQGVNDCSYTPFVLDEQGHLYIFISQLAHHTRNLVANPNAGLLFIEDESDCRNLYARKRLSLHAYVAPVSKEDTQYPSILNRLSVQQGKMVDMLRQLPDFQLFELIPREGRFVRGFGDAWELKDPGLEVVQLSRG